MERKGTEFIVGLFMLIGISAVALLIVWFGQMGRIFQKFYPITVTFPNASGLTGGAEVLLAGAKVGHVAQPPKLIPLESGFGVSVILNIKEAVIIPKESDILVAQSGLLGDCYVDIIPRFKADVTNAIPPGATVQGTRNPGMDDLTKKGGVVMDQLTVEITDLQKLTRGLHEKILSEENAENLRQTIANLKTTSANFAEASKKLDALFLKVDSTMEGANRTMVTTEKAAADLRGAIADLRGFADSGKKMIDSADKSVDTLRSLMLKAERGEGAVGLLLNDRETAENLRSFAANLRRSGVLWYKDRAIVEKPQPTPVPKVRPKKP